MSRGSFCWRSISSARGATTSSANSRTVLRNSSCSGVRSKSIHAKGSRSKVPRGGYRMVIGVPSGRIRARYSMARLCIRMHPWLTRCPMEDGSLVPWSPITPPHFHVVITLEKADSP